MLASVLRFKEFCSLKILFDSMNFARLKRLSWTNIQQSSKVTGEKDVQVTGLEPTTHLVT